jgi:choline dehydrogenase
VVDARARVHGIAGLRVADCSIMPRIPRATTAMPAIVVGEKVARMLLEDAS